MYRLYDPWVNKTGKSLCLHEDIYSSGETENKQEAV